MYALYSAGFASAQVAYARWLDKKKAFAELVKKTEVSQYKEEWGRHCLCSCVCA